MATYGKKRHIIPLLQGPRESNKSTESKRHKAEVHGFSPHRHQTAQDTDGSSPLALSRYDSIDELAAILLEDTIMEDRRVKQVEDVNSSRGLAMSANNPSRVAPVTSHFTRGAPLVLRGPPPRHRDAMNLINACGPDNGRVEEILPKRVIRSCGCLLEHDEISQPKAFSPNSRVNLDNMEAIALVSKDFKPVDSRSSRSEQYLRAEDDSLRANNNLNDETKPDAWRSPRSKPSNLIDNRSSPLSYHGVLQAKSSAYNPSELNKKIEAMMAATQALKPDGAASVRPGPYSPAKSSRLKDETVLSKMKTAMSHPFQTLTNKKSPESEMHNYIRVISQPQLISKDVIPQSAVMERRINEGDNLQNPKIVNMTGHGHIRRKPLPSDAKYLRSQNPTSHQIKQSASEPILEMSSDRLSRKAEVSEADSAVEPFPKYDSNYDLPFSSSPIAQSTPRIRVHPVLDEADARVKSIPFPRSTPVKKGINAHNSGVGMPLGGQFDAAFTRSVQSECAKERPKQSRKSSNGGRMKKHPSPSKAQLEKWEDFMMRYPSPDIVANLSQASGACDTNVSLHPLSNILAIKTTNAKVREAMKNDDKKKNADMPKTQVSDVVKKSAVDDAVSRSKKRKSFVSKNRSSKPRSRESTRSSHSRPMTVSRGIEAMEIDELQWNEPGLLKKVT